MTVLERLLQDELAEKRKQLADELDTYRRWELIAEESEKRIARLREEIAALEEARCE